MRSLAVTLALACSGCGAVTGLDVGGGSAAGGGPTASIAPAPCETVSTRTLYAGPDSAYGAAAVADQGTVGLLFCSDDPVAYRGLRFARLAFLSPQPIDTWIPLITGSPIITQAGVAAMGGAFFAAWVDETGFVHVGRMGKGALDTDVIVGGSPGLDAA